MAGKDGVYRINVVDQDGVHPAEVFEEPVEGHVFSRALKFDNETAAPSWISNDAGELPQAESPDGDYSDLSKYGVTWHWNK